MERTYYKAINFDLDTNNLKKYYDRYQQAYSDLLRFFKKNGFSHRQGSGYVSEKKLTSADIIDLIDELRKTFFVEEDRIQRIVQNHLTIFSKCSVLGNIHDIR